MKVFLDSNIWLRHLIGDQNFMQAECSRLLASVEQGFVTPYASAIVLLEVGYVLHSVYQMTTGKTIECLDAILKTRGLTVIDKTRYRSALALHRKTGVKMSDCLIATQLGKGITLCTYDREFLKIPHLIVVEPKDVLSRLAV